MLLICRFFDLIIHYNLILPVADVKENTVLIAAFSFSYEKFAVLNSSKEYFNSVWRMIESLSKKQSTTKAVAAA